jgi:cytoskeletal protein CcmA (bactofilin family)
MREVNFRDTKNTTADGDYILNSDIVDESKIKIDSSFIVFGDIKCSDEIVANYSLNVNKNLESKNIIIRQNLICYGDIKCDNIEIGGKLRCYGNLEVRNSIKVGDESVVYCGSINNGNINGNFIVTGSLEVKGDLFIKGNVICTEGILGSGKITCDKIWANDYLEVENVTNEPKKCMETKSHEEYNLKQIEDDEDLLSINNSNVIREFINYKKYIIEKIRILIAEADDKYDNYKIIEYIDKLYEIDDKFCEDSEILAFFIELQNLNNRDDLLMFLELTRLKEAVPSYLQNYKIVKELYGDVYDSCRRGIFEMDFCNIKTHFDFIRALSLIENLKYVFSDKEKKYMEDKIYEKIGVKSNFAMKNLLKK